MVKLSGHAVEVRSVPTNRNGSDRRGIAVKNCRLTPFPQIAEGNPDLAELEKTIADAKAKAAEAASTKA